ncbi:MAG: hypothetical protein M0004_08605 [Actinomycetota bacterium]|nr:hypothetical protein [Actinomycetota bacterium]
MRVMFVGTVPPVGGPSALAFAAEAARVGAEGHQIQVVSADMRAVSHQHARLQGFHLPIRLAAASRHFDRLVLRFEPNLPFRPDTQRFERALLGGLLSWAVRGFGEVSVWMDSPMPIPAGLGGRTMAGLWAKADQIVVANEEDRLRMLEVPGVGPERVMIAERREPLGERSVGEGWPSAGDGVADPRAEILDLVRQRARNARRQRLARQATRRGRPIPPEPEEDLQHLLMVEGDPTLERRTLPRLVLHRLLRPFGVLVRGSRANSPFGRLVNRGRRMLRI